MHNESEQKMLCTDLPNLFFEDVTCKFEKHFVKQWCGIKLVQLAITSVPKVSSSFAKWLRKVPIPNNFFCEINKITTHLPSCAEFIVRNVPLEDARKQQLFIDFKEDTSHVAQGESLLKSSTPAVQSLSKNT